MPTAVPPPGPPLVSLNSTLPGDTPWQLPPDTPATSPLLAEGTLPPLSRWMGWRLRLLVAGALLGCLCLLYLGHWLAESRFLPAEWRGDARGHLQLSLSSAPALQPHIGKLLVAVDGVRLDAPGTPELQRAARWMTSDMDRGRYATLQAALAAALDQGVPTLHFADGSQQEVVPLRRGYSGLPGLFWLFCGLALLLYLVGLVVLLAQPSRQSLLYALMVWCQTGNMVFLAVESTTLLVWPAPFASLDMPLRSAFDLITAAASVHSAAIHPRRLPAASLVAWLAWGSVGLLLAAMQTQHLVLTWWWVQALSTALGLAAIGLLRWSYRTEPHPLAAVQQRFGLVGLGTWVLLTVALAAEARLPGSSASLAAVGTMAWYVFLASLLLLLPFLSRSQKVVREFSLLATISTIATSLDLLFVAVFSLGQFASLTLSLFLALAVYAGARQWILNQLLGNHLQTTERTFEQLYRLARDVEVQPERMPALLSALMQDLFDPMEISPLVQPVPAARVLGDGSALLVAVPVLSPQQCESALVLRYARRGRRLFTSEDARLADHIAEQLRRAVAYDRAVEQGRNEERIRLAQDLHDDIGARLLTLMYTAPNAETEAYVRHTLQDLKTLTRGLASPNHHLADAAAEWKTDIAHRLAAARMELVWTFQQDSNPLLTVVQWSALTRILRELVSNTIAHSGASQVTVVLSLAAGALSLVVSDNGHGKHPQHWSHGLGLGGVRKRVKQLGGRVAWRELSPQGIGCEVVVSPLGGA